MWKSLTLAADRPEGWTDLRMWCFPTAMSGSTACAFFPHSRKTRPLLLEDRALMAAVVNSCHPFLACEFASWALTVRAALSRSTPWSLHCKALSIVKLSEYMTFNAYLYLGLSIYRLEACLNPDASWFSAIWKAPYGMSQRLQAHYACMRSLISWLGLLYHDKDYTWRYMILRKTLELLAYLLQVPMLGCCAVAIVSQLFVYIL